MFDSEVMQNAAKLHAAALEDAIRTVALAGGGKVVEPRAPLDLTSTTIKFSFILVVNGQPLPPLPWDRTEYLVPPSTVGSEHTKRSIT